MEDFWRMMWEYQCGCIVMLCQLEEDGQVCRPDTHTHTDSQLLVCVCGELQESSYCYWPGEEGEEMVCGRLRVRLVKVRGHSDIVERNMEIKESQFISNILSVKLMQLISWPLQGLPHPSAIVSLVYRLTNTLMSLSSK